MHPVPLMRACVGGMSAGDRASHLGAQPPVRACVKLKRREPWMGGKGRMFSLKDYVTVILPFFVVLIIHMI